MADALLEGGDKSERADVADLIRHLQGVDNGKPSWTDSRTLPAHPDQPIQAFSWCEAQQRLASPDIAEARALRQPGGFRRAHMTTQAENDGVDTGGQPASWSSPGNWTAPVAGLFKDYKAMVEHGYSFAADDCFSIIDDHEETPDPHFSSPHKLSSLGTCAALFKANIGLIVILMPGAWKSGGWIMATAVMPVISAISVMCGLLLIRVRSQVSGSYGDLMFAAFGKPGRVAINTSVVLVLLGTICGYMNTISQLMKASLFPDTPSWIVISCVSLALVPPGLLRKMGSLRYINLCGSMLVFAGLIVILVYEIMTLSEKGPRWDEVVAFNESGFFVFIGIACSAFEGAACLVPIYDAALHPEHFHWHYALVMTLISCLLTSVGLLGYLAYGKDVDTIILVNFTPGATVSVIQVAYSIGAFCTMPIFFLPSITLMEVNFFTPMSNPPMLRKFAKNAFRIFVVALLAITSIYGAAALENFTSMLGAVCGVPLAFVFPALVHLRLVEDIKPWEKVMDYVLIISGLVLTVTITIVNALNWGKPT